MIKILMIIFIIRPIIDLFWDFNVGPTNVAGILGMILSGMLYFTFFLALKRRKIYLNRTNLIFIVYCTIVTLFTFNTIGDLDNLFRILSSIIFLFILSKNITEQQLEKLMKWFIIITLVPIIISFLQAMGIVDYTYWDYLTSGRVGRASGGYRQPSVLTRFLTFSNLYCLYFMSKYKENLKIKRYCITYLILSCASVFLSYHRTGYLMNTLIIVSWGIINNKFRVSKLIFSSMFVLVVVGLCLYILNELNLISITFEDFKRLISFDNVAKFENGTFKLVLRGRGRIIEDLIYYARNSPWYYSILGNGINNNLITGFSMEFADMDWIRIAWNYGLVGIVIWVSQYISFINILIKGKLNKINKYVLYLGVYSIVIYIIFGFTIEATITPNFMSHIYLIIGYIGCNISRKNIINELE